MTSRYTRLEQLRWDLTLLKRSTALVVGVGALGNEVLKNLALVGFGNILSVDLDTISEHNLTRSVLFRESDIGKLKAETAARGVQEIDSSCRVRWFNGEVQRLLGIGIFRRVDLVFGCLDNLQTRIDVCRSCMVTGTPYIDGGLIGISGRVKVFGPPFDICFDCGLSDEQRNEASTRWQCLKVRDREDDDERRPSGPTAPTISSMIAALQVQIGLKILHHTKIDPPVYPTRQIPYGRVLDYSGTLDEMDNARLSRDAECPTHAAAFVIPENIIVSAPRSASEMTVREVLEFARTLPGMEEASIDLLTDVICGLNNPMTNKQSLFLRHDGDIFIDEIIDKEQSDLVCKKCGNALQDQYMPNQRLQRMLVTCEHCGTENRLILYNIQRTSSIEGDEWFLDHKFEDLGLPLASIVLAKQRVVGTNEMSYSAIEFSADLYTVFQGLNIPKPHPVGETVLE